MHSMPQQVGVEYKRYYFTEENTPFPLPNLHPRLKAKYFKLQSHRIPALQEHFIHCWVDAGFRIESPYFLQHAATQLDSYFDIAIEPHPLRNCIYEEVKFIQSNLDNPYLASRYASQPLNEELEHYWSNGMPEKFGLWACGMFMRDTTRTSDLFDEWWDKCLQWSYFDQIVFPFLVWKYRPSITKLQMGDYFSNKFYSHQGHLR